MERRSEEEGMPRSKESDLEKAARNYKAKTGVVCDDFHPKVPLDLTRETRGDQWWNSWRRWNGGANGRNKLAQRCSPQSRRRSRPSVPVRLCLK